nr:MAG TPA: hypothetical protein [Caudoviricetes sp.]
MVAERPWYIPENVTLRFFSAGCVGVRFVCDVPHASFCGLYMLFARIAKPLKEGADDGS